MVCGVLRLRICLAGAFVARTVLLVMKTNVSLTLPPTRVRFLVRRLVPVTINSGEVQTTHSSTMIASHPRTYILGIISYECLLEVLAADFAAVSRAVLR